MSRGDVSEPAAPRLFRLPREVAAGTAAFAIQFIHGTAPAFLWDAAQYWGGAAAFVAGEKALIPGGLTTRGVFTAVIYLPPAFVTLLIGPESKVWTVLAWNALLCAALCVLLLPRLAGMLSANAFIRPPSSRIWTSTIVGGLILSGFARFPLVDVWATSLALAGLYGLVAARRWWWLSLAGICLTIAINVRPSMIAPIALALAVLLTVRAMSIAVALPAATIAVLPQVIFNFRNWASWSPVPHDTIPLSAVQAGPATYTLRYDTVAFANQAPQQWYCDPQYAALISGDSRADNQIDVILSALRHLPGSVWFLARKAAINFQWSVETPYGNPPSQTPDAMAFLVVAVAVVGLTALVVSATRRRLEWQARVIAFALLAFWCGGLATVLFSTPETRFALPMVLIGLVGLTSAIPENGSLIIANRGGVLTAFFALLLTIGLFLVGTAALRHALPPGPLTDAAACATYSLDLPSAAVPSDR